MRRRIYAAGKARANLARAGATSELSDLRRRQALMREIRAVNHHAMQRADLRGDAKRRGSGSGQRKLLQLRAAAPPTNTQTTTNTAATNGHTNRR